MNKVNDGEWVRQQAYREAALKEGRAEESNDDRCGFCNSKLNGKTTCDSCGAPR